MEPTVATELKISDAKTVLDLLRIRAGELQELAEAEVSRRKLAPMERFNAARTLMDEADNLTRIADQYSKDLKNAS